jgi:hypothetical protein
MNTRKVFPTLEELWTCCAQEETRLNYKGKPKKEGDAQAFATKFKRHGGNKRSYSRKKFKRDMSKVQCFECHNYGHYKHNCPKLTRKRKERHHPSIANVEESSKKTKHDETYFFYYSAITGTVEDDMWLIDSGASMHMTGDRKNLSSMKEYETPHKVELGDNNSYAVKGIGQATIKMESGDSIHLSDVLYVPSLKMNLVYISSLEEKQDRVAFVDGKVLVWTKDSTIENVRIIGTREGSLYKLVG